MENSILRVNNTIVAVVYNTVANGTIDESTYRVTLASPVKGYRNVDDKRIEVDVISYLVPRNVLLAQVLNKIPMAARVYDKKKKAFEAVAENKNLIMPFIDELNIFVKDAKCVLECEFHAAGEVYVDASGAETAHKKDKWNVSLVDIEAGALGQQTIAGLEEIERQKAVAELASILGF